MEPPIFWLENVPLAIGPCPEGGRLLEPAIRAIRDAGVDVLVSLQTSNEARQCGLSLEGEKAREAGIEFLNLPITDHSPPNFDEATFAFVEGLAERVAAGKRVMIHCFAGIGRSATIAAGVLIALGYDINDALEALANARGMRVPETQEQYEWISDYADEYEEEE